MKHVLASQSSNPASRRTALVVFALALAATLFATWREHELVRREQVIRWQDSYYQLQPLLQPFLVQRFFNLHSLARNLMQNRHDYSEKAWLDFVKAAEWQEQFPGMSELGYAELDGGKCIVKFSTGKSSPAEYPPGFDLNGQPAIRDAVTKAAENSTGAATQVVVPKGATNATPITFSLMTLKKEAVPLRSPAENRANTQGFVFFQLDQRQYFQSCRPQMRALPFDLRLLGPEEVAPPKTPEQRSFTNGAVSGEWRFAAAMRPVTISGGIAQWFVLAVGLALSVWLYFLFVTQARLRGEAELARTQSDMAARDVAERKQAELELHQALAREQELSRLKGNFVSMVSHEIRTPLALIMSSSEMLAAYLDRLSPEKRQRHLETITDAVQRMALLVDDVLLFSRAEAGRLEFKPAAIEINSFCTRLVDELESATHRRCPIQINLPPPGEPVHVDEFLLRHILTNLLTNAVKYSSPGSPVSLEARHSQGLVSFSVRDHGIGISEADLEKIFMPFFRGHNAGNTSGTGLGLVIVKFCVERHSGKIHIESHEGEGTLVTVELPVCIPGQTEFFLNQLKPRSTDP